MTSQQSLGNLHQRLGVRRVLNATGTWTDYGSAVVNADIANATAQALKGAFVIDELQDAASVAIAEASGSEAGFVTNCSAAGLCLTAAALVAGTDAAKVRQLPIVDWPRKEILIQKGHAVDFGAHVAQMVRMSGADVIEVGAANWCEPATLSACISPRTAGALYVSSHLCPQRNQVSFRDFAGIMNRADIPVIVDAAAEFDIRSLHANGADLAIQSLQKFPEGPTAGIVSGRTHLVAAVRAQSIGLGRPMKAPKEAIVGAIVALKQLASREQSAIWANHLRRLGAARDRLTDIVGISISLEQDPTGSPLSRLRVTVDEVLAGVSAKRLAELLLSSDPVVATRDSSAELGYFLLDPRSVSDTELWEICDILRRLLHDVRRQAN